MNHFNSKCGPLSQFTERDWACFFLFGRGQMVSESLVSVFSRQQFPSQLQMRLEQLRTERFLLALLTCQGLSSALRKPVRTPHCCFSHYRPICSCTKKKSQFCKHDCWRFFLYSKTHSCVLWYLLEMTVDICVRFPDTLCVYSVFTCFWKYLFHHALY